MNSKQLAEALRVSDETIRQWSDNDHISRFLSRTAKQRGSGAKRRRYTEDDARVLSLVANMRADGWTFEDIETRLAGGEMGQWPPRPREEPQPRQQPEPEPEEEETGTGLTIRQMTALIGEQRGTIETLRGERDYLREKLDESEDARREALERASRAEGQLEVYKSLHEGQSTPQPHQAPPAPSSEQPAQAEQRRRWWQRLLG
jgi:DNA-binding transcriptional MerR regulator